ncbi:M20 family metallopeptidase [Fusibacter sp. 3D3]|uniref:M20 family metallopeptidase n=1 Tax=Fusibacter sp. 3D3 TaxID=1048380 RepID=UPI000853B67B|nr:M20 family metallopeptidase [Fusibacter sp. 3D3]GAU76244.1 acetylornithine deacetylase [Fusibacter sp. 3D3]
MLEQKDLWRYVDRDFVIELTKALVSIPSHKEVSRQETEVAKFIKTVFEAHHIPSEIVEVEAGRCNVIAKLEGRASGKRLLLNGHLDTVPIYGMKEALTPVIKDGHLFGRGAVDMKGPIAAMITAMIALKRMNTPFEGSVQFAGVIDEEEKSLGTIHFLENLEVIPDGVIVGEPTNLNLCVAHRGLQWIEILIKGKTVHGGNQAEGLNAISLMGQFIPYIEAEMKKYIDESEHPIIGRGSFNIGTIKGGTQPSTVAGECLMKFDRRWLPSENLEMIMAQVEHIVKSFEQAHLGYKITYRSMDESIMVGDYSHESMDTSVDAPIVKSVSKAIQDCTGEAPMITAFPAWSDGGLFHHFKGISTVVCGPGKLATAHSDEECIEIESLLKGVEVYVQSILEFLK